MLRGCLCLFLLPLAPLAAGELHVFHHENVLGTLLELRVQADSAEIADQAESAALAEIDRLSAVLSTYEPQSEISRWQQGGRSENLSPDLRQVLRASDRWQSATGGAFHPGVEAFTRLWRRAEQTGVLPTAGERRSIAEQMHSAPWEWTSADSARPSGKYPISLNAIAKGAVIEKACRKMRDTPGVAGAQVKIGGDLRAMGDMAFEIEINSPRPSLVPVAVLDRVEIRDRALATSSGAFRGVVVDGKQYSHLIDPRTGMPVEHIRSATAIAPQAADADALATACSVLSVRESLALVEGTPDAACLLLDREGTLHRSRRWPSATAVAIVDEPKLSWNGGMELDVSFEINQVGSGGRYRRPYVAVWVEDGDGFPVKTLVLWVQSSGPGPRWIPDLKRWYRSDRVRKLADDSDLVRTVSEATRKPGQYNVTWDGQDDAGRLVKPGDYTIYVEAAREHGTYQLMRKVVSCRDKPASEKLEGNVEIKAATIEYRNAKASVVAGKKS